MVGYDKSGTMHSMLLIGMLGEKMIIHDPWKGSDLLIPVNFIKKKRADFSLFELHPLVQSEGH